MIGPAKIYFIIFGLLTIVGGVMGYVKAGSTASLIAGSISGILLLVAAFLLPGNLALGLALAGRCLDRSWPAGSFRLSCKTGQGHAGGVDVRPERDRRHHGDRRLDKEVTGRRGKISSQDAAPFSRSFLLAAVLTAIVLRWISLEQWHRTQLSRRRRRSRSRFRRKSPTPAPPPEAAGDHRQARYRAALQRDHGPRGGGSDSRRRRLRRTRRSAELCPRPETARARSRRRTRPSRSWPK